jgi:hypothetical protein
MVMGAMAPSIPFEARIQQPLPGDGFGSAHIVEGALRRMRVRFGNAGKFESFFKHAVWRAQALTKTLSKTSNEKRRDTLRPTRCVGRCDRHP